MKKLVATAIVATGLVLPTTTRGGPAEVAEVLSQLIINTRAVIAENFTKPNKVWWLPDPLYRHILTTNEVLPAAVAGKAFHPLNTSGVVSLKMVVEDPRNDSNRPDPVERELYQHVVHTGQPAARLTPDAAYHARPIKSAEWCLRCHGEPKGAPDPNFPKYKKEGWRIGEVIGAAIARVRR